MQNNYKNILTTYLLICYAHARSIYTTYRHLVRPYNRIFQDTCPQFSTLTRIYPICSNFHTILHSAKFHMFHVNFYTIAEPIVYTCQQTKTQNVNI